MIRADGSVGSIVDKLQNCASDVRMCKTYLYDIDTLPQDDDISAEQAEGADND